jgi:hypothetical protein
MPREDVNGRIYGMSLPRFHQITHPLPALKEPAHASPGQRPGFQNPLIAVRPEGAQVPPPFQGGRYYFGRDTRGVAPGLASFVPLARQAWPCFEEEESAIGIYEIGSNGFRGWVPCGDCGDYGCTRDSETPGDLILLAETVVPGGRVELPTPAFSGPRSTGELPRRFGRQEIVRGLET